jgi:hypothetical protein
MYKNLMFDFDGNENTFKKQEIKTYQLPVYRVSLVRDSSQSSPLKNIKKPADVYEIMKSYQADKELFYGLTGLLIFPRVGLCVMGVMERRIYGLTSCLAIVWCIL